MSNVPQKYKVIKDLGQYRGGCNAGILIVRNRRNGNLCIEKKFPERDVQAGISQSEIEIHDLLGHSNPYIVGLRDKFLDRYSMRASIFLEYCEYGTLGNLLERHVEAGISFGEDFIWNVISCLTEALTICHYGWDDGLSWNPIPHRDIKLDNLFVTSGRGHRGYPRIKLGDFGLSVAMFGADRNTVEGGTPYWMPPEAPRFCPRSDIWQLGGVVVALCQMSPFPVPPFVLGREYSPQLKRLARMCMSRVPEGRPRSRDLLSIIRELYGVIGPRLRREQPILKRKRLNR